jgi:hypothetical protein
MESPPFILVSSGRDRIPARPWRSGQVDEVGTATMGQADIGSGPGGASGKWVAKRNGGLGSNVRCCIGARFAKAMDRDIVTTVFHTPRCVIPPRGLARMRCAYALADLLVRSDQLGVRQDVSGHRLQ